ncbi:MAG: hypothetical protein ACM31O_04510 [Bacteroidota bacterium]
MPPATTADADAGVRAASRREIGGIDTLLNTLLVRILASRDFEGLDILTRQLLQVLAQAFVAGAQGDPEKVLGVLELNTMILRELVIEQLNRWEATKENAS